MKTDLRIQKSRAAIENAFINLVELKGFQNVTITEIAEKAMVNRNTIYLNYGAKEDILASIVKASVQKYFGNLSMEMLKETGLNRKKIEGLYENLFQVVNENIELFRIILTDSSSTGYLQAELNKGKKLVQSLVKNSSSNSMRVAFMMNGILGILNNYITYAVGTTEENIKMLTDLTISNLRHMKYAK